MKQIVIKSCGDCPHLRQYMECGKTRMTIPTVGIIPDWCPLEIFASQSHKEVTLPGEHKTLHLLCRRCGNDRIVDREDHVYKGTHHLEQCFCLKCEKNGDDFHEILCCDIDGNEIEFEEGISNHESPIVNDGANKAIKFISENPYQDAFVCDNCRLTNQEGNDNSVELASYWSKQYDIIIKWLREQIKDQLK